MAEYMTMSEVNERVNEKTRGARGLGLAGTITGGLALAQNLGLFGGLFGNVGKAAAVVAENCGGPTAWEAWQKECSDAANLTKNLNDTRIADLKEKTDLYLHVNNRLVELEKKDAALEASLPLAMKLAEVNAERYTDNRTAAASAHQNQFNFMFQRELDTKISGDLKLPWSAIYTGIPKMPNTVFDVTTTQCGRPVV